MHTNDLAEWRHDHVFDTGNVAGERGARLVVFPEATMRAFGAGPLDEVAEELDGPWAGRVAELAREHDVVVVAGMFRPGDDGRVRNTLLVTGVSHDADGDRDLHLGYDKIHLFDAFGFAESDTVRPGDRTEVVRVDDIGVGLTVCYDVRFPGLYRRLAGLGAEIVVCRASWGSGAGKLEQWRLLTRARALDSTCVLVAAGQADPSAAGGRASGTAPTGVGHSQVVAPDSQVVAAAGAGVELLVVDVDVDAVRRVRSAVPVLANGRVTESAEPSGPTGAER